MLHDFDTDDAASWTKFSMFNLAGDNGRTGCSLICRFVWQTSKQETYSHDISWRDIVSRFFSQKYSCIRTKFPQLWYSWSEVPMVISYQVPCAHHISLWQIRLIMHNFLLLSRVLSNGLQRLNESGVLNVCQVRQKKSYFIIVAFQPSIMIALASFLMCKWI